MMQLCVNVHVPLTGTLWLHVRWVQQVKQVMCEEVRLCEPVAVNVVVVVTKDLE